MDIKFKSIDDVDLKGKKVLLRVDLNSPIDHDKKDLRDDPRIRAAAPTVKALNDTALVVVAHQGRPGKDDFTSLEAHAKHLQRYVDQEVHFVDDVFGDKAVKAIKELKVGEVLVLDNVRGFLPDNEQMSYEEASNTELVKTLAPLFDYFVNDAFGAAHRGQPSLIGWPTLLAGPLVAKELKALQKVMVNPDRPMAMLVGGAKAGDKFKAIKYNIEHGIADKALVAGLTAILLYEASGKATGDANKKIIAKDLEKHGEAVMAFMEKKGDKVVLPVDFAYEKDGKRAEVPLADLPGLNVETGDLGSASIEAFKKELVSAKTIIANGPPGIFEKEIFRQSTMDMIDAMIASGAYTVIGGGEMGTAAEESGKADKISFISTGGGAMLEFLGGKELPLFQALARSVNKF